MAASGSGRPVRVRIAPTALQLALVQGRPEGWRPRPHPDPPAPDRPDWIEGSFRYESPDGLLRDLLALGPEVEVVLPVELRQAMADVGRRIAALHGSTVDPQPSTERAPSVRTSTNG